MKSFFLRLWVPTLLLCCTSCMEEQDFGQADDLNINPRVASGILYFESDEGTINDTGASNGEVFYSKLTNFEAFNKDFMEDRLLEGLIVYELTNTTSKALTLEIEYLDESGNRIHGEFFGLGAHPSGTLTREVAYGPGGLSLALLTNTSDLRFNISKLGDASSVSSDPDPKIVVRVAGEFIVRLQ